MNSTPPPAPTQPIHPPMWAFVVVILTGVALSVSSRVGGAFAVAVKNPFEAALVNFVVGWVMLVIIIAFMPAARKQLGAIPGYIKERTLPWWALLGGFAGAFYVAMQCTAVPMIGVAIFTVAVVAGQTSSSLLIDRFGIGPAGRQVISGARVVGAVLTVVAVAIAVSNRFSTASISIAAVLAAIGGGIALSGQQAFNGRLGARTRQPIAAALVSFTFGLTGLAILVVILDVTGHLTWGALPTGPWWIYLSGAMGVIYIAVSSWVVPKVGVLIFGLLTVVGQLGGALLFDIVAPLPGSQVSVQLIFGLVLTVIAVAIATRRKKPA